MYNWTVSVPSRLPLFVTAIEAESASLFCGLAGFTQADITIGEIRVAQTETKGNSGSLGPSRYLVVYFWLAS
jgi:hypothetical protein